jgi:hypothetical protein
LSALKFVPGNIYKESRVEWSQRSGSDTQIFPGTIAWLTRRRLLDRGRLDRLGFCVDPSAFSVGCLIDLVRALDRDVAEHIHPLLSARINECEIPVDIALNGIVPTFSGELNRLEVPAWLAVDRVQDRLFPPNSSFYVERKTSLAWMFLDAPLLELMATLEGPRRELGMFTTYQDTFGLFD